MNSTTLTRQMKLEKWSEIFRLRQESGLSVSSWCKEKSISKATYYYWLKCVRQEACNKLPVKNTSVNPIVPITFEKSVDPIENNSYSSYSMRITTKEFSIEFTNDATCKLIENTLRVINYAR